MRVEASAKAAAADGLWVGQTRGLSKENLSAMLRKVDKHLVNPWDTGRKCFRPMAVFTAAALGRFPSYLFGSPEYLEKQNLKTYEQPTPQRLHILSMMRNAHNPLTGKRGISRDNWLQLISGELKIESHLASYLDAETGRGSPRAFDSRTGQATYWGSICATILNSTVEETFPFSVAQLEEHPWRRLPMNRPTPLAEIKNKADPDNKAINPEYVAQHTEAARMLREALSGLPLTARQKNAFVLRVIDELDLKQSGQQVGISGEAVRRNENRVLGKLRLRLISMGIKSNPLSP